MSDLLRILLIGSGGREAALACKLDASPLVSQLYIAPGLHEILVHEENQANPL